MGENRVQRIYDKRAVRYDSMIGRKYNGALQQLIRDTAFGIPQEARIIDAGAGTGIVTEVMAEMFPHGKITAQDFSSPMLSQLKNKPFFREGIEAIVGNFNMPETMQLPNNHYDLFIGVGSITEYGRLDIVLPWAFNLLRRGGLLHLLPSNPNFKTAISSKIWAYKPKKPQEVVMACISAGFVCVEFSEIDKRYTPISYMKYKVTAKKS
jgi:ubiquinone/menaquinone biosynthesis C-methylase UbiE